MEGYVLISSWLGTVAGQPAGTPASCHFYTFYHLPFFVQSK